MKKIFLLLAFTALFSCNDDDSNSNDINQDGFVAFFRGNVNGQPVDFSQNTSLTPVYFNQPYVGYNGEGSDKSFYYSSSMELFASFETYPSLELTLHNMYQSTNFADETANFNTTFDSKPTNFITYSDESSWVKGVSVTFVNSEGEFFSSLGGSQSGSSITYNSMTTGTNDFGFQTKTITGTLNCTLYNESDPSQTITLTNGSFKLTFQEFD